MANVYFTLAAFLFLAAGWNLAAAVIILIQFCFVVGYAIACVVYIIRIAQQVKEMRAREAEWNKVR